MLSVLAFRTRAAWRAVTSERISRCYSERNRTSPRSEASSETRSSRLLSPIVCRTRTTRAYSQSWTCRASQGRSSPSSSSSENSTKNTIGAVSTKRRRTPWLPPLPRTGSTHLPEEEDARKWSVTTATGAVTSRVTVGRRVEAGRDSLGRNPGRTTQRQMRRRRTPTQRPRRVSWL